MTGTLLDIAIASKKRAPMERVLQAMVTKDKGILGDARGRIPHRQVTVLFEDAWNDACRDLGQDVSWLTRRANLLVRGMAVPAQKGLRLRIGAALLEVTEETAPCIIMERAVPGLRKAMTPAWRGGVCCIVIEPGEIVRGDNVSLIDPGAH